MRLFNIILERFQEVEERKQHKMSYGSIIGDWSVSLPFPAP